MVAFNSVVIGNFTDLVDVVDGISPLQNAAKVKPLGVFALFAVEPPVENHKGITLRNNYAMLVSEINLHPVDMSDLRFKYWLLHITFSFYCPGQPSR